MMVWTAKLTVRGAGVVARHAEMVVADAEMVTARAEMAAGGGGKLRLRGGRRLRYDDESRTRPA